MRVERDGRELFQPIGERFGDDSDGGLDACGDLEGELPQVPFVKPGVGFESADSSGGRNEFCELLRWCQIAERFAWSSVERVLDRGQLSAGDDAQIGALRQVLA